MPAIPPPFLLTSIGHIGISLGHTLKSISLFSPSSPSYRQLTLSDRARAVAYRNGWYQGSVFFLILGLINYKWHQNGNFGTHWTDKPVAALAGLCYLISAVYYKKVGDDSWLPLSVVAGVQGWAAFVNGK